MIKKILCLFLAGLMLASVVACGEPEESPDDTGVNTTVEVDTAEVKPNLPEKNYKGDTFTVLGASDAFKYVLSSKTNGEVVNDAVVEANLSVSNQFNIKFDTLTIENDMDTGMIQGFIMAGDDVYDVAYLHDCTTATASLQGWFLNINDLPYMDTSAQWWPQFTVDSLTLNGKMYYYSNYASYQSLAWTRACFFNQKLLTEYRLESPYDLVRNDSWNLDKITEMSTSIYNDLNGDGIQDKTDLLGFAFVAYPYGWLESFGIEMYQKEAADSAVLLLDTSNERSYTLIDKLHTWFYSGSDSVYVDFLESSDGNQMFAEDHVAFTFAAVGELAPMSVEANIDYGIVPIPKIDKNQEDYYAGCNDRLFSVPNTVKDQEQIGIVLEAMAYAGYKYLLPAYCEKTLQTRFATDPDCGEMLNLIFEKQVISFAYLFANAVPSGIQYRFIADTVKYNKVASFYKSKERPEKRLMQKITEFYEAEQ